MTSYAPIALFVYKRLDLTRQTVDSLQKNYLAGQSHLYIFSDAAKSQKDAKNDASQVAEVREYIAEVEGFLSVTVINSPENKGCAKSIISGVSQIFETHEKIIVVEDDLVTTPNFLNYMNAALDYYEENKKAFAIAGWSISLSGVKTDVYFIPRTCSWGWASWKDRWQGIDWAVSDYEQFKNDKPARKKFNQGGADLSRMLDLQMAGKIDSWAIRWCYAQYKMELLTVFPKTSKAKNIGFEVGATHTVNNPNFPLILDDGTKTIFDFNANVKINAVLLKQHNYYTSIPYKIKNRLRNYVKSAFKLA